MRRLIYPDRCLFCGRLVKEEEVCSSCSKHIIELTAEICPRCGASPENCSCINRDFSFVRNVSAFSYEGAPRTMLLRYKQRNRPQLHHFIARRMYFHIEARIGTDFDRIVYVPQSAKGFRKRGYCPSQLLAKELEGYLNVPMVSVLKRVGNLQQKYVKHHDRWSNAKQNYALRSDAKISGKVLLVDDLFTTGATLNACAELLRQAGAESVYAATFAIAAKKG